MKKIEFLYFEGCPSYKDALKNLKDALSRESIDMDIELINVESLEMAEKFSFQGSPSVRFDGRDIENRIEGYNYSCRIYTINGEKTGIPAMEFFLEKIQDVELHSTE